MTKDNSRVLELVFTSQEGGTAYMTCEAGPVATNWNVFIHLNVFPDAHFSQGRLF